MECHVKVLEVAQWQVAGGRSVDKKLKGGEKAETNSEMVISWGMVQTTFTSGVFVFCW